DLHEVELDRGGPAEDRYEHPQPALLRADLLHRTVEAREGAVDHAHGVAGLELDLGLGLERALGDLRGEALDLLARDRRDLVGLLAAHEARHPGRGAHQVPSLRVHLHLDEDVAREELPLGGPTLALDHLDHLLGGNEDLAELGREPHLPSALLDGLLHPVFVARVRVDHVKPFGHRPLQCGFERAASHPRTPSTQRRPEGIQSDMTLADMKSIRPRTRAAIREKTTTAIVPARSSGQEGQVTFRSSPATPCPASCTFGFIHATIARAAARPIPSIAERWMPPKTSPLTTPSHPSTRSAMRSKT